MNPFTPGAAYQATLDVRFTGGASPSWASDLLTGRQPNDVCWLVVMGRRAGKSWLASAIENSRTANTTTRVDLRAGPNGAKKAGVPCLVGVKGSSTPRAVILVDEPGIGQAGGQGADPATLAQGLRELRDLGSTPILFATPNELSALRPHLGVDSSKDVVLPPDLDDAEILRMAGRAPDWAVDLAAAIRHEDPSWLRLPFLLELILQVAHRRPQIRDRVWELIRCAIDDARDAHDYVYQVFGNGLSPDQRSDLRRERWLASGLDLVSPELRRSLRYRRVLGDPIVADHMPEVIRIHHLSDLHIGGDLRANIDRKDLSEAGEKIADVAGGTRTRLDSYLAHLEQLSAQDRGPHVVVVTGDIVDRPEEGSGQAAVEWLAKVRERLASHRDLKDLDPRIILVGGNHDVAWDLALSPDVRARHQWFADIFFEYPHPDLHLQSGTDRTLTVDYVNAGLRVVMLGSAESGGEVATDSARRRLKELQDEFTEAIDSDAIRASIRKIEHIDPGVVSRSMLDQVGFEPGWLTFAVLHHPLSAVPSVEIAPYSGVINAGQVKRALVAARTALVMHGHTHLSFLASERLLCTGREDWTLRIAGAPTLAAAASDEQNGYNQVFVLREGGQHAVVIRPMRYDGGQWVGRDRISFRPGQPCELSDAALIGDAVAVAL